MQEAHFHRMLAALDVYQESRELAGGGALTLRALEMSTTEIGICMRCIASTESTTIVSDRTICASGTPICHGATKCVERLNKAECDT